jgi:cholesterol oxidase
MAGHYTAVVIGSGYGGGVLASRIARAGQSVCVLERGKELHPGEYPRTAREGTAQLQVSSPRLGHLGRGSALFDLRLGELAVLVGCGLGGGSLINASVGIRPDPGVFDDSWPAVLRGRRDSELLAGYDRAEQMLRPAPYPWDPPKFQALGRSANALGSPYEFKKSPIYVTHVDGPNHVGVEQRACNGCGDCVSGCNYGAKNTVLMNYLPDARNHGAHVFTEVRAHHVERDANGWRVYFEPIDGRRRAFGNRYEVVTADIIVLAAGSLGSTEILLRSRQYGLTLSNQLGQHFSGNGGFLAFGYGADQSIHAMGLGRYRPDDRSYAPPGPCITGMIEGVDPVGGERRVIEDGDLPGPLADIPRLLTRLAPGARDRDRQALAHTQVLLATCQDGARGTLSLDKRGNVQVSWPHVGDLPVQQRTNGALHRVADGIGATYFPSPEWGWERSLLTVHPLGGCAMADDAAHGVVNDRGQVFATNAGEAVHPGLYVADGSILPNALAYNPSLTITAMAERVAALLIRDRQWDAEARRPALRPIPAERPVPPSLSWRERMVGPVSIKFNGDFDRAARLGDAAKSTMELDLTVTAQNAERFLHDLSHECHVQGSVVAPVLSPDKLEITQGTVRLFTPDPEHEETRRMEYQLRCRAPDGATFRINGHKVLHDDPGFDMWSDTTTLYVTAHRGDGAAEVQGIVRLSFTNFVRELATMSVGHAPDVWTRLRYVARFGEMFFGALFWLYGKVIDDPGDSPRTSPVLKERVFRLPIREQEEVQALDGTRLRLTHYAGGGKGPVIVAHAFGTSIASFLIRTTEMNLTEFLVENDYDVWLFDYRASTALPTSLTRFNMDDIARSDWPAAVNHVRQRTGADSVQVIAHCVGSMTFLMALLAGMEGVQSAVCSSLTTHPVPNPFNRVKVHLGLSRILPLFGMPNMDTAFHQRRQADRVFDRLIQVLPIPPGERCTNPICRRVFAIYGPSYRHAQLNDVMHRTIGSLFGHEHTASFSHLAKIVAAGRVIDASGQDVYLPHLDRLALPIRFLHGALNQEFLPATSEKTYDLLCQENGASLYSLVEPPGYGHLDVFIGREAPHAVFPAIVEHLDAT